MAGNGFGRQEYAFSSKGNISLFMKDKANFPACFNAG
jgi:hypothetical protein